MGDTYEDLTGRTPGPETIKDTFQKEALAFIGQLGDANPIGPITWEQNDVVGEPLITTVYDKTFSRPKPAMMLFLKKPFDADIPEKVCAMLCVFIGGFNPTKMVIYSDRHKGVSLWFPYTDDGKEYLSGNNLGTGFTRDFLKDTKGKRKKAEDLESYINRVRGLYNHYNSQINPRDPEI